MLLTGLIKIRSGDEAAGPAPASAADGAGSSPYVVISPLRCLRAYKPSVPCTNCAGACQVAAVSFGARAVSVSADCLGCGACAAECPTGAIAVAGFARAPASEARLRLECARVPPEAVEPGSWVAPCFAGLRVADAVEAIESCATKERASIHLIDRGLCEDCPASGGRSVAAVASSRLAGAIVTLAPHVSIDCIKAPFDKAKARPAGAAPARSRRAFLRGLIEPARTPDKPRNLDDDRAALARLAARAGSALDARHFPAITLSQACKDHRVCSASCPTSALRRETAGSSDEIRRLVFEPAICVACGRCAEVCPELALTFAPAGAAPLAPTPLVLRESVLPVCPKCEEVFAADGGDEAICPACRKSNSLFVDLFAAVRGGVGGQKTKPTDRVA